MDLDTPRVLINREHVGEPTIFGGGFYFDEDVCYRDAFVQGSCDDNVQKLCQLLGWEEDLTDLMPAGREGSKGPSASNATSPPSSSTAPRPPASPKAAAVNPPKGRLASLTPPQPPRPAPVAKSASKSPALPRPPLNPRGSTLGVFSGNVATPPP